LAGQAAALHASAFGQTVGSSRQGVAFVVSVAKRFAPAEALATLAHELAHIYCGHLGRPVVIDGKTKKRKQLHWSDRSSGLTQGQREFEAEATAYLVCRRIGLETKSADYLAGYLSTTDRDHISYAAIIRAAARIEALMPSGLAPVEPKSAELGPSQTELFPGWYGWSVQVPV
jgi:antirestriction protein ArdC